MKASSPHCALRSAFTLVELLAILASLLLPTLGKAKERAQRTGFTHSEYLSVVFRREVGLPPGRFGEQHR